MVTSGGLLLLLLGVSRGLEVPCDGRNNGNWCYVTVGETLSIQLFKDASGIPRFELKTKQVTLLKWKSPGTVTKIQDRFVFIPSNGTFRINDLRQSDSGEYQLKVFDKNGKLTENWTLHLSVEGDLPVKGGVIAAVLCVVFCFIGLIVFSVLRIKPQCKVITDYLFATEEDPADPIYADVEIVLQSERKQVKMIEEEEVEYGEIKLCCSEPTLELTLDSKTVVGPRDKQNSL